MGRRGMSGIVAGRCVTGLPGLKGDHCGFTCVTQLIKYGWVCVFKFFIPKPPSHIHGKERGFRVI